MNSPTLFHYFSLIHNQALMKLKAQANVLVLSYIWWVLEPILFVLLFYFVFKYVLYRGGDDFFIFLMVGKIPFLWFQKSVTSGANSLIENRGLIAQRPIPKIIFPLVNCQESLYKEALAFLVLIIALLFNGYFNLTSWVQILPVIVVTYLLICSVTFVFTIFVTVARDFNVVISMLMLGLMFTSGIFWDVNMIQDEQMKQLLLTLNPIAAIIDEYRQLLMYGNSLDVSKLVSVLIWALALGAVGVLGLNRLDNLLTRRLFS